MAHAHAVVVGASLAGLMTALALVRRGIDVIMLERSDDSGRTGAALQVGDGLVERLTGTRSGSPGPGIQTWFSVHAALRTAVDAEPRIRLHHHVAIERVEQDADDAWAIANDGCQFAGDVVIGADGYRSIVRRAVAPDHPDAIFAGYVIWLGLSDERAVSGRWPGGTAFLEGGGFTFLGYPLPSTDGVCQLGWAWYDAGRGDLLRETGAVVGGVVQRSLRADDLPDALFRDLDGQARRLWPAPWRDAVRDCVSRRAVIGTPIAEYVPDRLANGRLCLVGDAAHVPTPMTGNGFAASLADAEALADALVRDTGAAALARYEAVRLGPARDLVRSGQGFSRGFARAAA